MAWQQVDTLEDEGPGHIGGFADNFAVHQVAQTDEAGGDARGNGNVVHHAPEAQSCALDVEPQGQDDAGGAAMRGQTLIAGHVPRAILVDMDRQQHLDKALPRREEVVGLVEDAVAQARTDQNAQEAVDEQRLEQLVLDLLLLVQAPHHEVGQQQAH